jgi:6-phosphogluconolactonase (cycloisomerase 2 family)
MALTRIQPAALDVTLNYRANNFTANGFTFADGTTQTTAPGGSVSNPFIKTPYQVVAPQGIQNTGTGLLTPNGTVDFQALRMTISPNGLFAYSFNTTVNTIIRPYSIDQTTGALTALATTTINSGSNSLSLAIDPKGTFLYVGVNSNATIQVYNINQSTGLLTYTSTYSLVAGTSPRAMTIDPTGKFLYVTSYTGTPYSLYQLNIDQSTGALSTGSSVVLESFSTNYRFSIEPTGRFLYISIIGVSALVNTVEVYAINQSTGALTLVQSIASGGTQPQGLAVDPSGRFVYVVLRASGTVAQFSINQTTGQLTSITSPIAAGTNPTWVEIDPSGRFVYTANYGSANFSIFSINQVTGELSASATVSLVSGTAPNFVVIDPTNRFAYGAPDGSVSISQYLINSFSAGQASITRATVTSAANSTSNTTGSLIVIGGVGISGNLYSGGLYITGSNGITFSDGTIQTTAASAADQTARTTANTATIIGQAAYVQANTATIISQAAYVQANAAFAAANTAGSGTTIGIINTNTVLSNTKFILASNTITLTLPTAVGISGTSYTIKNVGDGQITVIGQSGQTIDTNTSMILAYKYSVIGLVSDGTNWQIF